MARTWTKAQENAIRARRGALLVSAAAGSGKTSVLVERFLERITDGENPSDADRLLVVTYTRAAAEEMRGRISRRIDSLLEADPGNLNLRRQQVLLSHAHISTCLLYTSMRGKLSAAYHPHRGRESLYRLRRMHLLLLLP